ncbi:U1 small nuclear ribonucleoprotein 70 kDa-like [Harpegnathos saltator]|uniref:U1 small nuclear ribonucleoprotein 70 kDa-like n=1 Tax=Harpegnathos saltator TaxID=610380 RepID=UPI000DBED0CC|nr:U1 small nuclear ribonucleoprotein 70 kDa-like [Harpegnathos saltator]
MRAVSAQAGSGSAAEKFERLALSPPVARHGILQRPRRLHHRYRSRRERFPSRTRLLGKPQFARGNKQKPSRNERRRSERGRGGRERGGGGEARGGGEGGRSSTAKSFAEVGERRWGKFSFAGCR